MKLELQKVMTDLAMRRCGGGNLFVLVLHSLRFDEFDVEWYANSFVWRHDRKASSRMYRAFSNTIGWGTGKNWIIKQITETTLKEKQIRKVACA